MQILKYRLPSADCNVRIPWGATYMSLQEQEEGFFAFFLGDPDTEDTYTDTYRFVFLNTGDTINDDMLFNYKFIGSVKTDSIIKHVFMHKLA